MGLASCRSNASMSPATATAAADGGTTTPSSKWDRRDSIGAALLEDTGAFAPRAVQLSDNHLLHLALEAAQSLDWPALSEPPAAPQEWTAVKLKDPSVPAAVALTAPSSAAAATRVLCRREGDRVVAVAHTVLPCSLQELTRVLDTAAAFDVLRVIHGDALVSSECIHRVESTPAGTTAAATSGLTVTAVAFTKRRRSSALALSLFRPQRTKRDEWCFVDYVQRINPRVVRKTLLTMHPSRVLAADIDGTGACSSNNNNTATDTSALLHDILAGYVFEEQPDGRSTRVSFWGEHALQTTTAQRHTSSNSNSNNPLERLLANRAGKARLVRLAASIDRFLLVVRRRRLGAQVLVDDVQVLASNTSCMCCSHSLLLARKRTCQLCGYFVCSRCSRLEDRERRVRAGSSSLSLSPHRSPTRRRHRKDTRTTSSDDDCTSIHSSPTGDTVAAAATQTVVTRVWICDKCVVRVDQCNYNSVTLDDLAPPRVRVSRSQSPLSSRTQSSASSKSTAATPTATPGTVLASVLRDAIETAPSTRRAPVLTIVRDIVNESSPRPTGNASSKGTNNSNNATDKLTAASSDAQHFAALQRKFELARLPAPDACTLADRTYLIDHSTDVVASGGVHPHPVPATEQRRLVIVRASHLTALANVDELEIICAIVSSELGCLGVMISVSESDAFHVVATNIEALPARVFPRSDGFCSRTIMGTDPMLVPHPEADIRFSYILPVKALGVSFYCGFPLFADDYTVLGSMCCLGSATGELTQEQFVVGKKLAETASRILQHHVKLRTSAFASCGTSNVVDVAA